MYQTSSCTYFAQFKQTKGSEQDLGLKFLSNIPAAYLIITQIKAVSEIFSKTSNFIASQTDKEK